MNGFLYTHAQESIYTLYKQKIDENQNTHTHFTNETFLPIRRLLPVYVIITDRGLRQHQQKPHYSFQFNVFIQNPANHSKEVYILLKPIEFIKTNTRVLLWWIE